MGEMRNACRVLVGKPERKDHYEHLDLNRKIILKCILKKKDGGVRIGFIWLRIETSGRLSLTQ
jgi:hypothetical protein